jgi:hypothetical protein
MEFIARAIIKKSFNLSVWIIERFNNITPCKWKVDKLRKLPEGTLGRDIAKCLDDHNLTLVPNYESHDLKHVLLNFQMTPVDEIRMQAFMLGNGNYSPPCFAILTFGLILLPRKWSTFYKDFQRGRKSLPISSFSIDDYSEHQTSELRSLIFEGSYKTQPVMTMKTITKYGSLMSIFAGIAGMLFCLPFLFSSSLADLVGAGFPFVGGAILTVGGLLTLSNLSRQQTVQEVRIQC